MLDLFGTSPQTICCLEFYILELRTPPIIKDQHGSAKCMKSHDYLKCWISPSYLLSYSKMYFSRCSYFLWQLTHIFGSWFPLKLSWIHRNWSITLWGAWGSPGIWRMCRYIYYIDYQFHRLWPALNFVAKRRTPCASIYLYFKYYFLYYLYINYLSFILY